MTESKGIESDLIPKIASGFSSGISRTYSGLCGAVSGAIMAISIFYGRNNLDEQVVKCYKHVQKFIENFTSKNGSINCKELLHCDMGTDEGRNYYIENNLIELCKDFAEDAAGMAISEIEEEF